MTYFLLCKLSSGEYHVFSRSSRRAGQPARLNNHQPGDIGPGLACPRDTAIRRAFEFPAGARGIRTAACDVLLNTIFRMKHGCIGRAFGRDRTTATHACKVIEDLRDDPAVEMLLGACEPLLVGLKDLAAEPALTPRRRRSNPAEAPTHD